MTEGPVLFPTDFSPTARQALTHAMFLADDYDVDLHLLHAVTLHEYDPHDPEHQFPEPKELLKRMFEIAGSEMADLLAEHDMEELTVREVTRKGFAPADVILRYADEIEAGLIVMGTHGRRGPLRFVLGSVASEVVRRAGCPVLTLRHQDEPREIEAIERILVPVDFSEPSKQALAYAEDLAVRYRAGLQLLHVVEVPTYPYFYVPPEEDYVERRRDGAARALNELAAEALTTSVPCETSVSDGRAASEIVRFAEENESDMLVISTHGLSGLERLLLGSTAEEVLSQAECPVVTVKATRDEGS